MTNLLTEEDLAKQLNVSLASLRRWRLMSRGPRFIKVGALVRYRPRGLGSLAVIASNRGIPEWALGNCNYRLPPVGRRNKGSFVVG